MAMSLAKYAMDWSTLWEVLACLLVFSWLFRQARSMRKGPRLPPGPLGKLLLGNLGDLPAHQPWETITRWGQVYGALVHVRVLTTHILYVNSAEAAHELFEKRSSLYSDRFVAPMLHDLMGSEWVMPFTPYGDKWRHRRRIFNESFHQSAVVSHYDVQTKHTRAFLRRLYDFPTQFTEHTRHLSGSIIMEVVYGIQLLPEGDPYIETAESAMAAFAEAATPGTFLVDTIPLLKYVPAWIPGAGFRKKAQSWRENIIKMAIAPYEHVKRGLATGTAEPSVVATLLEGLASTSEISADDDEAVCDAAGTAYLGGSDTTVSVVLSFFLAMVLYPEVQRKAQNEVDTLLGNRLPGFEHRKELPYVNALCKELLRWHPVLPLAIAHKVTQDDVYGDFFIPRGSIIIGNSWAMLRDEKTFGPETDKFKPERFLEAGVMDPTFTWGYGRRMCPGRHTADNSVFIAVASVLKMFDITHATDGDGNVIPVREAYTSGFLSYPEPFECAIRPRPGAEILLYETSD